MRMPRSSARVRPLAAAALIAVPALANVVAAGPPVFDEPAGLQTREAMSVSGPSTSTPVPGDAVYIGPTDDAENIVASSPPGTFFVFQSGVHYEQGRIVPKDGDTFVGESGAVLDGRRPLPPPSALGEGRYRYDDVFPVDDLEVILRPGTSAMENRCYAPGVNDIGVTTTPIAYCGHEREVYRPEMLFDGDERLRHVNEKDDVVAGSDSFHYDADGGTLTVGRRLSAPLFTSRDSAFRFGFDYGEYVGARNVRIEGLVIRGYANRVLKGAIEAMGSYDLRVSGVVARDNHGPGIRVGSGSVVTDSLFVGNGDTGVSSATDTGTLNFNDNEVRENGWLEVHRGFQRGGVKLVSVRNAEVSRNYIHGNQGTGLWIDAESDNVLIRYNRIESNNNAGLHFEISRGGDIHHNLFARNRRPENGTPEPVYGNVVLDNASDTTFADNTLYGGAGQELVAYAQERKGSLDGVVVRNNSISIVTLWNEGVYGVKDLRSEDTKEAGPVDVNFLYNDLFVRQAAAAPLAWNSGFHTLDEWTNTLFPTDDYWLLQ